jgi:hypothetical protein
MPVLFGLFPFLIGGIIMWFVAHQLAPFGRDISLGRAIFTVFLMGAGSVALNILLQPSIGNWSYSAGLLLSVLVVKGVLQLTFWRSVFAVFIYWVVVVVASLALAAMMSTGGRLPAKPLPPTRDGSVNSASRFSFSEPRAF